MINQPNVKLHETQPAPSVSPGLPTWIPPQLSLPDGSPRRPGPGAEIKYDGYRMQQARLGLGEPRPMERAPPMAGLYSKRLVFYVAVVAFHPFGCGL
jgi:hypothetical protein